MVSHRTGNDTSAPLTKKVQLFTDDDIGLHVLHDPTETASTDVIDIVAIHGIGAHPDRAWSKNVSKDTETPRYINWLSHEDMLLKTAPNARVLRYGYESAWFGDDAMRQNTSTVANRLLLALRRNREDFPFRPILFIAHCFGGLVVLKALIDAQHDKDEWPGIFDSTTGLVFFGTPFRGAEGMKLGEMIEAAQREYQEEQLQTEVLRILEPGNEFLQDLVDQFGKTRRLDNKALVACFYELKSTNVGKIVGKQDRIRFVVNRSSGCLDLSDSTEKYSLSRTHFNMNKFGKPTEEDFQIVSDVLKKMVKAAPAIVAARSPFNGKYIVSFDLKGVPLVNQFFGRDTEMRRLEEFFGPGQLTPGRRRKIYVIHGLGGMGKTQLAIEFARNHHRKFSAVFWLNGSSEDSLNQSYSDIARRLPQDELTADTIEELRKPKANAKILSKGVLQWLSLPLNMNWLTIIDNVDRDYPDPQAYNVKDYFPLADHGSIMITSRLPNLQQHGSGSKLGTVDAAQAMAILSSTSGRSFTDCSQILNRLQGLPLALTQAGSYLRETNMTISAFTKHYDDTWKDLMQAQDMFPLEEYSDRTILTTWKMSYEQVKRHSEEAASLLKLWAFLDSGDLWYELIATASDLQPDIKIPAWLLWVIESELRYATALRILYRYSLVDAKEETSSHSMHAVLHKWCYELSIGSERTELQEIAAGVVAFLVPERSDIEYWKLERRLLPHGLQVYYWLLEKNWIDSNQTSTISQYARIFRYLGDLFRHQEKFTYTEELYKRALNGSEKTLGSDHKSILDIVHNLGVLYVEQGKLVEAEEIYNRVLKGYEKTLGPDHTSTLNTIHGLGILYVEQGKLAQAEEMYNRALKGSEKARGPDHTLTLDIVHNLGILYVDQGKLGQSEDMYNRALKGSEKDLGHDHILTLDTVFNLGALYVKQGKLAQAEEMCNRALKGYEKALGPDHTTTLNVVHKLGILYKDQGELAQANILWNDKEKKTKKRPIKEANIDIEKKDVDCIARRTRSKLANRFC